ncbi:MAG: hypothetical protein KAI24_00995 [Planctomycetes bacterium]|nr:hypothetical protein [Planctomycetota bacterium]
MYFCAVGLVVFVPFAYLILQVITVVVYEGNWRFWSLAPILVVLAGCVPLLFVQTPVAVVLVSILAPVAGIIALACVWGLYTRWAERQRELASGEAGGGEA